MKFSIIVVSLNPGEKLKKTLESIFRQTCTDYEVILKDGGSRDGSVDIWRNAAERQLKTDLQGTEKDRRVEAKFSEWAVRRVRFFDEPDKSIYEAMNQAVSHAEGEFILFLNCGDSFADEKVLERTAVRIDRERAARKSGKQEPDAGRTEKTQEYEERMVFYGNTLGEKNGVVIASAPEITGFTCYRNIPCHQSCFYSADLCKEKPYDSRYKIRADYDHFLWCFYVAKAEMVHMDFPVAVYEGGGYSESRENLQRDRQEHKEITEKYMSGTELLKYKAIMALTLAPLRRAMAENKAFSGIYHWMKEKIYKKQLT